MINYNNSQNIISGFLNADDILEKGKRALIGEIRTWNGEKWKKQIDGWIRLSDNKKKQKLDDEEIEDKDVKNFAEQNKGRKGKFDNLGIFDNHYYQDVRNSHTDSSLTSAVKSIVENKSDTQSKVTDLFKEGLKLSEIVNVLDVKIQGALYYLGLSNKNNDLFGVGAKSVKKQSAQKQQIENESDSEFEDEGEDKVQLEYEDIELPDISVEDRWDAYKHYGMMIGLRQTRAMIAYGSGGVGKTYELLDPEDGVFAKLGLKKGDINPAMSAVGEDGGVSDVQGGDSPDSIVGMNPETGQIFIKKDKYDYVTVTGKISPPKMFAIMQEHNGKIIVFDDCDSVFDKSGDGVNILKGALDTSGDGTISWESTKDAKTIYSGIKGAKAILDKEGDPTGVYILPKTFKFTGQICFISNLPSDKLPQPLKSRSIMCDLTMNRAETIAKINRIYNKVKFKDPSGNIIDVGTEARENALKFMQKYIGKIAEDDLNMRTYGKVALMYHTQALTGLDPEKLAAISLFPRKK